MKRNHKIAQATWLRLYETALVAAVPALAGRVDWDTANYFYYQGGDSPEVAAAYMAQRWADHDVDVEA